MLIVSNIGQMRSSLSIYCASNKPIGLVPTMGALHEGHIDLVNQSVSENDITVVSIFVNPLQFNDPKDFESYPSDLECDIELLSKQGVDYIFIPEADTIYPGKPLVTIDFGELGNRMEGYHRPGHFDGVGVIVSKLFHIIQPDRAYFGLKDLQQYLLIRQMVNDLSFPLEIIPVPTRREPNGLAMSSRNRKLSENGKTVASIIYKGLEMGKEALEKREKPDQIIRMVKSFYSEEKSLDLEYCEMVDGQNLKTLETFDGVNEVAICVAAYVEGVRLIDNLYLRL